MKTLKLSQPDSSGGGWDLTITPSGDIAVASEEESVAQDVASRCKLFLGDLYFDQTQGVPYLTQVLGQGYSQPLLTSLLQTAALAVPTVQKAKVALGDLGQARTVSGKVEVITTEGQTLLAHF
jgi:hypothetical protein